VKNGWILAAVFALGVTSPALADEPYKVNRGDTLWGISGKFFSSPPKWPVLWSKNPQIHNPHWIDPGDPIYLEGKKPAEPTATVEDIRLPVEVLTPPPPPEPVVEAATGKPKEPEAGKNGDAAASGKNGEKKPAIKGTRDFALSPDQFSLKSGRILDYISPKKAERLGTIRPILKKDAFAENEEVFVDPVGEDKIAAGDTLAIIDDSREIFHPSDKASRGYQVRLLGAAEVLKVENGVAKIRIIFSNDTVTQGFGVMPLREFPAEITPGKARSALEGFVLAGEEDISMFGSDDVIFLDKGAAQGLERGNIIAIPFQARDTGAEGLVVETDKPIAVGVVVSAEENSSTVYVLKSRYTIVAGQRFATVSDSP
jgi:hypothetical protein